MLKQRHQLHAAGATTSTALHAAADCHSSFPSAGCSRQQAAAAWAWFEHGGSTCITPSKAEGLVAGKRRAKHISAGRSRFSKEFMVSRKMLQDPVVQHAANAITESGRSRRRHSFHNVNDSTDRTSYMHWRFRSSCRSVAPSSLVQINIDKIADQNGAEDEEIGNISCQDEASSLLDKFEVDAVRRQLHDHLNSCARRRTCSSPRRCACSAVEPQEYLEAKKAYHDHPHRTNLKTHPYFKSSDAAAHKPSADNVHHHINIHDVVHRLLHMHIKTRSGHSTSPAPALCRSIATADSIVDRRHHHHHPASPKQLKAVSPINTMKMRHGSLSDIDIKQNNTGRVSHYSAALKPNQAFAPADEGLAAAYHEHDREDFTSKHVHRKSQQKVRCRDRELIVCASTPSRLHQSNSVYSKALLAHKTNAGDQHSSGDDGVEEYTNKHQHLHEHHYIHHHHHHYHLLQQVDTRKASQDALWPQDCRHIMDGKDGAGILHVIRRS